MKKKFKQLVALGMVSIMVGSFTGCGNNSGSDDPTKAPTKAPTNTTTPANNNDSNDNTNDDNSGTEEVTYDFGGVTVKAFGSEWGKLDDTTDVIAQEAKEYVEKKYNIKLEKSAMEGHDGTNEAELLIASIASGDPITNIITLNPESMTTCFLNGMLYDITDYLDVLQVGSLYSNAGSWQGRCYGISYDNLGDSWRLVYDRQLLEDIGMEKTPTDMFMEGKWDYQSFKAYLTEMKSKLPEGVYPIGQYPYHWAVMAASANGVPLVDNDGQLNYTNEAVIEAMNFYQELVQDGLAYPAGPITKEDGSIGYDYAYSTSDDRIVIKRAEAWELGGLSYEFGITFWPWGSNVTCSGDYTTLSDNYKIATSYWGFDAVIAASIDKLGIPGDVLTQIVQDYRNACSDKDWMHDAYVAEQSGAKIELGAEYGEPRNFHTEQDIVLADWGFTRFYSDFSWTFTSAGLVSCWYPFRDIFCDNLDTRSTLESYYNSGVANLNDAGVKQK